MRRPAFVTVTKEAEVTNEMAPREPNWEPMKVDRGGFRQTAMDAESRSGGWQRAARAHVPVQCRRDGCSWAARVRGRCAGGGAAGSRPGPAAVPDPEPAAGVRAGGCGGG